MNSLFFSDLELIKRDEKQYEAFCSKKSSVVIAGPGSGKTRVLTLKAIALAGTDIKSPSGLACISFSRETVRELRKRLKLYGYVSRKNDFIGTVHSFSLLHVLEPFGHLFPEYRIKYPIRILPDEERDRIHNTILKELAIEDKRDMSIVDINKHRSLTIKGRSRVEIESNKNIGVAAKLFEEKLSKTSFIDFTGIINVAAQIIHDKEFVRHALQCKFPWLLVDEYQDLGKALHEMVLELVFNASINLYAVGDGNQSIYGFNGGYPEFLNELAKNDNIKTIFLNANYRSSQHIIDASIEALNPTPPAPTYTAENVKNAAPDFSFITCEEENSEQFELTAHKIIPKLMGRGTALNEIGIIVNSNADVRNMARILRDESIPFFIANWQFENSAVVVWLQECANWCVDQQGQNFDELVKFWISLLNNHDDSRKHWPKIQIRVQLFNTLTTARDSETIYIWLKQVIGNLKLMEFLPNSVLYPDETDNLQLLLNEASLHSLKDLPLRRFAKLGTPEGEVTITTRHSSKGLEFEVVILPGMEEGHFPNYYHLGNPVALAEDQRLCYVCISRAKKTCILLRSRFFTIQTKRGPWRKDYEPSRYWKGLYERFGTKANTFTTATFR